MGSPNALIDYIATPAITSAEAGNEAGADSLIARQIPCSIHNNSLLTHAGNFSLWVRNCSGIRADSERRRAETVAIP